ncbi:uncharacterized protein HD556DRAFT_1450171 [Suillus plorans]|uniref:Uncharacterized protein n=1 Tax=Suillus plorans TaxID=116603 RepID=A0A9P7DAY1_9AGAM|nr:uncharacterized protein HD556DRAFT_1450171 [Suillus plorans]KAG1785970.1 hypothetical protein HD556DRAFT_1450171 [Suillus plorans]
MSSDSDTRTNDSRPSDFNDAQDAILSGYANLEFESSRRSTPESHFGCLGSGGGQSAPAYSCGCYKHVISLLKRIKSSPSPPDNEQAFQLADDFGAEQPKPQLEAQDGDHYNADARRSKRKRSDDHDDVIPRNFGQDMTSMRATSVPVVERQPPVKRRKIGRSALAKVMQEVVGLREAVSRIETVIGRQNGVILEICNAIENHGM